MAIAADKKLVEKAAKKLSTPKPQVPNIIVPSEEITKKSKQSYNQICWNKCN